MKKIIPLIFIGLLLTILGHSQQYHVEQISGQIIKGYQPGFQVMIPESSADQVQKLWVKSLKRKSKLKPEKMRGQVYLPGVHLREINPEPVNIYTEFEQLDEGTIMQVYMETYDGFISEYSNSGSVSSVNAYLEDFAKAAHHQSLKAQLNNEQRNSRKIKNNITQTQRRLARAEKKLNENEIEIRALNSKSYQLQSSMSTTGDGDTDKQLNKEWRKNNRKISSLEKENRRLRNEMEMLKRNLYEKNRERDVQERKTRNLKNKTRSIR